MIVCRLQRQILLFPNKNVINTLKPIFTFLTIFTCFFFISFRSANTRVCLVHETCLHSSISDKFAGMFFNIQDLEITEVVPRELTGAPPAVIGPVRAAALPASQPTNFTPSQQGSYVNSPALSYTRGRQTLLHGVVMQSGMRADY